MKLLTQWAVTSSVLILIVLAVRALFRDRLSARLRYALWGVVLLRLLVPFQVELPAPVSDSLPLLATNAVPELPSALDRPLSPDTAATFTQIPAEYLEDKQPNGEPVFSFTAADLQVYDPENDCLLVYRNGFTLGDMAVTLWLAGAGLTGAAVLLSNLRFSLWLRKRRTRLDGVDAPIPVYTAEGLPSPCLFGVLRPAVYVTPQAAANPDALRHVLAHELTHRAHFDHIWSLLRIAALALHWYNPLVWLAVVLSKRDGELACDEGAVARLGETERISYGRTLVDMVAARSLRPADLLSCSTAMTGGGKSIQRRIAQLVKKPETVKAALFAAVAVVALAAVFVFAGRGQPQPNTMFLSYLDRTTAIRYSPPLYSSTFYPNPITREDLLAQAKEALRSATPLGPEDPEPDRGTLIHASTVSLAMEDESKIYYTLLRQDNYTYVLEGAVRYWYEDTQQDPWYSAAFRSEEDIISILESLARQSPKEQTSYGSSELDRFLADLESASSIRYIPTAHSSQSYPVPITDKDLLDKAKERLSTFTYLSEDEPYPDLSGLAPAQNPKIVLTCGEQEMEYTLMWQNNYTYLFPGDLWEQQEELMKEEGKTARLQSVSGTMRSQPGDRVFSTVSELALLQMGNVKRPLVIPRDTPELEEFFTQLEAAQSIYVGQFVRSSASPPGLISAPESLARAKELLGKVSLPIQLSEGVTREEFWESIRPFLSSTEYQDMEEPPTLTQKDLETMLFMWGNPIDLCPDTRYQFSKERRYWLADNTLLRWDPELEEEPIKLLATFSEDVYSQLAELARTNGALRGGLTQAQIDRANEAFAEFVEVSPGGYASSEISCFFTSNYDDPTQIDLEEFLRYCPIGTVDCLGEEDTEEFLAVMAQDNSWVDPEWELHSPCDLPVPVHRYPRAEVSALLQKYAGVTVEKLDWDGCLYVEKYDAFYNFTSDAGPGFFPCAGGQIMEDSVLLWSKPDENGDRCELVLRKNGDGWLIQSHHTIYER